MSFEEFQDGCPGGHLGYRNRTILAILYLCVIVMPPIKFQLNRTGFRRRCCLKNFKMAACAWRPSWISEQNDFSNFESLCHCDASHQVSAHSDLGFGRTSFEEFQDGSHGSHLGHRNGRISAILNLHVATMPPTKFQLNPTYGSGGDVKNVKS